MAVVGEIPIPQMGYQAFNEGLANSQSIFNSLVNNKKLEAETRKADAMAKLPFGGASVPGPAGQIVGLEMIKQYYGEDSQQYKTAMQAFNLSQQSEGSRIGYQNALSQSLPKRYTTAEGRQLEERSNVNQGYSPSGTPIGQPISPGVAPYYPPGMNAPSVANPNDPINSLPQNLANGDQANDGQVNIQNPAYPQQNNIATSQYDLRMQKQNVPAQVLTKDLYATNIEKTINSIDRNALAHFNGPNGQLQLKIEQAKDAAGLKTSKEYQNYVSSLAAFNILPNQVRQFYGSSVQPGQVEQLTNHLDPRMKWGSSDTGLKKFDSAVNVLRKELQTYRSASHGTGVYAGNNDLPQQSASTQREDMNSYLPNQTAHSQVRTKDGQPAVILYKGQQQYTIPLSQIGSPKLKGFTREPR